MAVVERWPANGGFLGTILYGDAVGTKVSGCYREGGRLAGVAIKRGSTVLVWGISCALVYSWTSWQFAHSSHQINYPPKSLTVWLKI